MELFRSRSAEGGLPGSSLSGEADRISSELILEGLRGETPDIPAISEESTPEAYEVRRRHGVLWLVDPLDGTKEFARGRPEFTVNIALVARGAPVAGVVHAPALGETYVSQGTRGSFRISARGGRQPIRSRSLGSDQTMRIVTSRSHLDEATRRFLDSLGPHHVSEYGSALKFCRVADGSADLYPRLGPTMEWDTAAGEAVLEAAGGRVRSLAGGRLRYNKPDLTNPPFVAAGDPSWFNARGGPVDG
jgi:3'(2'), 5'-bisphosphate nucleotidase